MEAAGAAAIAPPPHTHTRQKPVHSQPASVLAPCLRSAADDHALGARKGRVLPCRAHDMTAMHLQQHAEAAEPRVDRKEAG